MDTGGVRILLLILHSCTVLPPLLHPHPHRCSPGVGGRPTLVRKVFLPHPVGAQVRRATMLAEKSNYRYPGVRYCPIFWPQRTPYICQRTLYAMKFFLRKWLRYLKICTRLVAPIGTESHSPSPQSAVPDTLPHLSLRCVAYHSPSPESAVRDTPSAPVGAS
jgi:hypothetical protein